MPAPRHAEEAAVSVRRLPAQTARASEPPRWEVSYGSEATDWTVIGWIEQHALRVPADKAFDHRGEPGILFDEVQERPHLRRRITQPHRGDVAGDDVRAGMAVEIRVEPDGRVERVRVAVREHRAALRVGDAGAHRVDERLDGGGGEGAFLGRRAAGVG